MIYSSAGLLEYRHSKSLSGGHGIRGKPPALRAGHRCTQPPAAEPGHGAGSGRRRGRTGGRTRPRQPPGCRPEREITRTLSAPRAAVPGTGHPAAGRDGASPSGSPRCPPTRPASPYRPRRLVHPPRSGRERDRRSGAAAQVSGAGTRSRHRRRRRRRPPAPPPGPARPPELPRRAGALQENEFCLRRSAGEGGPTGFPELSRPARPPPAVLCPLQMIFCPDRERLIMGKTAGGKQGAARALSLAWFGTLVVTQPSEKGKPLHPPGESGKSSHGAGDR